MKCKVCGAESGQYPLCRACNARRKNGEIIKCTKCGNWHDISLQCPCDVPVSDSEKYLYEIRKAFISKSERGFFEAIKSTVPEGFCVFPQINLASFIDKTDNSKFRNELFRNVDFLVTNEEYAPQFIVEINDQTHLTRERKERDEKVQKICEEAGIPILRLWTSYGINPEYIRKRINETLSSLPAVRIHHFGQNLPTQQPDVTSAPKTTASKKNGCYIATCVYGSYDCSEVWVLRRFRDNTLSNCSCGKAFIKIYYAVSPILVKRFGKYNCFTKPCRSVLDIVVRNLHNKGYENTPYNDK